MKLNVTSLPSHFKPYPFKSFRMDAINFDQSQELGADPSLEDIRELIGKLCHDSIDVKLLVPIDLKYLIASLAFHAYPTQVWTLRLKCPYCSHVHTKPIKMSDFPPVPSFEESDEYPLTIDDGKHVYALGYASVEDVAKINDDTPPLDLIKAHLVSVDGKQEGMVEALKSIEDFGVIGLMLKVIRKYFKTETYADMQCPECKKVYRVPLSAVEVTQYTPFRDPEAVGEYKTNFRL